MRWAFDYQLLKERVMKNSNKKLILSAALLMATVALAMEQIELKITEKTVQPEQEIKTTNTIISPTIPQNMYQQRFNGACNLEKSWETASKYRLVKKIFDGDAINEWVTSMKNPNAKLNDPREKYLESKVIGQMIGFACCTLFCCPCVFSALGLAGKDED